MPIGHLWYVRRGTDTRGPFPANVIERNIGLGRITADDSISADGTQWMPAADYPDFLFHTSTTHDPVRAKRLDERQHERRAPPNPQTETEPRRGSERRADEDALIVKRRERAYQVWLGLRPSAAAGRPVFQWIVAVLLLVFIVGWSIRRPADERSAQCQAPSAPGVNWDFCDKQAIDLRAAQLAGASLRNTALAGSNMTGAKITDANLAYAELVGANLAQANAKSANFSGATLRGANLAGANFENADLQFADLTNAVVDETKFTGARLGNTIWLTGALCAAQSVGVCVLAQKP